MHDGPPKPELKTDSTSNTLPSNGGNGLDLLREGRNLRMTSSSSSADPYLGSLVLESSTEGTANITDPLQKSQVADAALSILDSVDKDQNGFLSAEELGNAVQDHAYKGQQAQVISGLYENIFALSRASDDELFFENSGISRSDITKMNDGYLAHQKDVDALDGALRWDETRFSQFDKNNSESLSWDEVKAGLESENSDADDRRILTYLKDHFHTVATSHDDKELFWEELELSHEDISDRFIDVKYSDQRGLAASSVAYTALNTANMQKPEISRSLFANQNNPELSVTPDSVLQGYTDDGYFLAAVAAVAQSDPESIVQMINENSDGTFTVTFPGDKSHPLTVDAPTDSELALWNHGSSSGIWASVLEKSYGEYLRTYQGKNGLTDAEVVGHAGLSSSDALKMLTGNDFKSQALSGYSMDAITELLLNNFNDGPGKPIVISTVNTFLGRAPIGDETADGFYKNQSYTVTGIKPNLSGGYVIEIRNPVGYDVPSPLGTTFLSIEKLQKNFERISLED